MSLAIPFPQEQDNPDTRTKIWYFDTPDYARPVHRRSVLSIYPQNISCLITKDMMPPSMVDTLIYQRISEFRRMLLDGTIYSTSIVKSIVDRWICIELVIRSSLNNNPELSSRMTGPIPKYLLITMGGFLGALFSRQAISKSMRILIPVFGASSTFAFCYPNTAREIINGIASVFSPVVLREKYQRTRDAIDKWQAEKYAKCKNKLYNILSWTRRSKSDIDDQQSKTENSHIRDE